MADHLTFRVSLTDNERITEGYRVFVTGALPILGNWQANGSLRMSQVDERSWSATVPTTVSLNDLLPRPEEAEEGRWALEYRYFVGKALKDGRVCVRRWEADKNPRRVVLDRKGAVVCVDTFGLRQQGGWFVRRLKICMRLYRQP